jgi:hypothetical protein
MNGLAFGETVLFWMIPVISKLLLIPFSGYLVSLIPNFSDYDTTYFIGRVGH